ncbi:MULTISPECIES: TlpA disulfide reductase family protein [unclassified Chelatococcus]|uniref:thiol:disulfide interchange protein TlpA n=1 Tax=unclassified Chelatococcus TaxID=2638111 RepID=UPI001BCE5F03|nr:MULTISPECIES: TlpA disulfide reductase family protein [unclassified Chelatococcus]CAH1664166.1 Thiol:disulfide interchange protein TlpA [Hyphomicrobiales bacterium]MBS7741667.1 TlpA family protein disulfide reductase [Chelatococcus sp. HY11]MBX3544314.1 TlpA family protein disulfide reductase [Chelatococcus sp.]MCO5079162.1 TlpA family protein disulfide reductase [Chelatococcus sp.]CAH1681918.1 Thiol:disulfide interchange protein TlpA [Hyphomicrobiales bacterium]
MGFQFLASRGKVSLALSAVLALAVAGGLVYALAMPNTRTETGACKADAALAARLDELARGEVAAVQVEKRPKPVPPLAFKDQDGKAVTLADFKGRTVLVNLWATWCVPCRKEMPALDQLQTKLGGDDFQVVAINIDTRNLDKPKAWLTENGIHKLGYYADPEAKVFQALKEAGKAFGMPTTVVVDRNGCMLASLAGPAEWASDDAVALIRAAMAR